MDSSIVLPITFWSASKPVYRISTISITPDFQKLVTGSYNGQLCIWDLILEKNKISPRNILIAHQDSVTCMAVTNEYIISCCEGKVMCRWNVSDGYCSKMITSSVIHRKIQLLEKTESEEEFICTCGDYSDIFVIHPFTLQVIFIFYSQSNNLWISNFQIIKTQDSQILSGITVNGCTKLWVLDDFKNEGQHETQSFMLPVTNVVDFKYNSNLTEVLIVSLNCWILYDQGFSNCLCKVEASSEEKLLGGNFCGDHIVIWTNSGKSYLYNINEGKHKLISVFLDNFSKITVFEPAFSLIEFNTQKYLVRGNAQGIISFWKLDLKDFQSRPLFSNTLAESWIPKENGFFDSFIEYSTVTCSIYVLKLDKFFVGCFDGSIVSIPGTESLKFFYFNYPVKKPETKTLLGHNGKINCLLYPHEKYSYYHKSHLVSGGSDFSVCLWDIFKEELLFKFCVQSGEIVRLIIPPDNCTVPVKLSICSVSSDHSVAVLNLKDRRCLILTSRHEFPVVTVHFKPLDDFIIVECFDGTVYVWQMETGHLDRILSGVWAQEVIYACSETEVSFFDLNFYIHEQNRTKKTMNNEIFRMLETPNCSPFKLNGFLTSEISESQIFLFDLENIFAQFINSFQSEVLDSNAYLLTETLGNDFQKKYLASLEKIKHKIEMLQEKSIFTEMNNFKVNFKDKTELKNDLKDSQCKEVIMNLIQFFISSIHFWGLNPCLDEIFSSKLGLSKPNRAICFGLLSQHGIYSLFLPTAESQPKSSSLLVSTCVTMISLCEILLICKNSNHELTESEKNYWKELFLFYEQICLNLTKESPVCKPNIEILAKAWQTKCLPLQKIIRKLLCNYLQVMEEKENAKLLEFWYKYLPHFKILDKTSPEKVDFENMDLKVVALVLFGAVGSDLKFKSINSASQENYVYQVCASFVYLLLLPPFQKFRFNTLQIIAIDFIGRGFIVWEQFLKMEKVVPMLFKICANFLRKKIDFSTASASLDQCITARNALKSIAIARTAAFINCLKNEVSPIRLRQNYHFLNENFKAEMLSILIFLLEKTPYIMILYLNDVISLVVHCVDFSHLRQENLANLIPVIRKFRQIHHSVISQRIAVGLATGSLVLYDLKTGRTHEIPGHKDSISALKFSEDGKALATYSCYENRLLFWRVMTGMFGLGNVQVKCTKSYQTYQIHEEEIRNHFEIASLTWTDKKSVMLSLCDGTKDTFQS